MSTPLRVLIVEDSEDDATLTLRELRRGGYTPTYERVDTAEAMRAALERQAWDVTLADFTMPRFSARAALELLQEIGLDIPFIIVSGSVGEEIAVAAMKAGAHDYLMKGNLTRLVPAVEREMREAEGRQERRRLEAQLLHAQKLESVGQLAGGVAHDFNNLLTVILGYSELLEETMQPTEAVHEYLLNIQKATEKAVGLTRQLLAFARRQIIEPKVLNLNDLTLDLEKMLRRLLGEDIEIVTRPDPALGLVKVDPGQFEQVLVNLAVNARDAMPDGGTLTIETTAATLDEESTHHHAGVTPGEYVQVSVSDTGCGMEESIQQHVFEPFFTTKEVGKGTGLGLATVYGIVKQSGGHIWLYSEPGHGTTFKIYLPRVWEDAPHAAALKEILTPHGTESILLVEDEPLVREIAVQALRTQGYTVLQAGTGREALALAQAYPGTIHLLVTDVVMPQMSGKQLAERLVEARPDVKVIYTSGYTHSTMLHHGVLEGEGAFLQKPYTPSVLARKVREMLDRRT